MAKLSEEAQADLLKRSYDLFAEEDFLFLDIKPVMLRRSVIDDCSNISSASNLYKLIFFQVTKFFENRFSIQRSADKDITKVLQNAKGFYELNLAKFGMTWSEYGLKKVSINFLSNACVLERF
jgi:hypothetical protein